MPTSARIPQYEFAEKRCYDATLFRRADVGIDPYIHQRNSTINTNLFLRRSVWGLICCWETGA